MFIKKNLKKFKKSLVLGKIKNLALLIIWVFIEPA